jgi:GH15 family glucan-1,4-alpha-glucosidase
MPLLGFLPPDDPRIASSVSAIEKELTIDGFVRRYTHVAVDGIAEQEGAFLICSFWLVDNLVLAGRRDDALRLFERLLATRNDVGLLAEQYDPVSRHQLGNFPQAFSHVGLVNSAFNLAGGAEGPAVERARR